MFTTRMPHINVPVGVGMASQLSESKVLTAATRELVVANPVVTVFACTSASFVDGLAGEWRCREAMLAGGANKTLTTSGAMLQALQTLGIERVAVVTPYDEETTARLVGFLDEASIETVACGCLGMDSDIFRVTPAAVANLIRATNCDEAQAVFVSCTNLRTKEIIRPLERELGKPVVSANQATMWAALRAAGIRSSGRQTSLHGQERLFTV
jgi:maleate isomerase